MSEAQEDQEVTAGEEPSAEETSPIREVEEGEEFAGTPEDAGPESPEDIPPQMLEALLAQQQELERMTKMFVKDTQHVNCPVVGCSVHDDGTLTIAFQVAPNEFSSFRVGAPGQAKIVEGAQKAQAKAGTAGLVIAGGPLPPEMTGPPQ